MTTLDPRPLPPAARVLAFQEFLAATIDQHLVIRDDNVRRAFQYFDVEGTGSITVADLVTIFGSEAHAREIVGACDDGR